MGPPNYGKLDRASAVARVQSDDSGTPAEDERFASRAGVGGLHVLAYATIAWAELTPDFLLLPGSPTIFWAARSRAARKEGGEVVVLVVVSAHYTPLSR